MLFSDLTKNIYYRSAFRPSPALTIVLRQVWNPLEHILTLNLNLWVETIFLGLFGINQEFSGQPVGN